MNTRFLFFTLGMAILAACSNNTGTKHQDSLNYLVIEYSTLIEDTLYYKIDYQFPYFKSDDEGVLQKLGVLNDSIQTFLDAAELTYWGVDASGASEVINETGAYGQYELVNHYEILDTTSRLISIKFETYSYALGAHGFTAYTTYNFDLEAGKLLKITDVLDLSDENKLARFNTLLQASFVNPDDCFSEEPKIEEAYDKFALSPDFLVVYFEAYELGPYSCGAAEILVSIDELKAIGIWKR